MIKLLISISPISPILKTN